MKKFVRFLEKNASGRKVLVLFILANLVYLFMLFITIPFTMEFAGGMKLLDMLPTGYDRQYVNELFAALGVDGQKAYLTKQIPVDMLYPLLFGLSYSLLMAYFLKRLKKLKTPFIYLCLLPLAAGMADYGENVGIVVMLKSYPAITEFAAQTTVFFSLLKSSISTMHFLALIVTLIAFGSSRLLLKRTKKGVHLRKSV